jgi:serine/threonine protein kinase
MSIHSVDDLVEALRQHRLLTAQQTDELVMTLQPGFTEPAELADDLVHRRWLTPYQVRQIFRGQAASLPLGQYVILDQLGAGAMADVFKALHRRLDRVDALKIVRPEHVAQPRTLGWFQQEARAAARLSHPNIVTIYDADEVAGRHYLAMEYVPGKDLGRLIAEGGPLPAVLACDYAWQAALGLQHAFERDIVHRDIKPANLLLTSDWVLVKILDMGLALSRQSCPGPAGTPTAPGRLSGTPDYIAPEQTVAAHDVDIRADVYSLGCTLYFLLTGRVPFPDGSLKDKLLCHRQAEAAPVDIARPDLPAGLAAVVGRMMAKRPEDRYQTPADVAEALYPFCKEEDVLAAVERIKRGPKRIP